MLTGIIFIWLITAIGLWIVNLIVPGIHIKSTSTLLKAALVLGLINAFIRPLLWLLTLPLTVLSFGLFALVVNAFTLWISAAMVRDFKVDSFASAILAAIVMALLGLAGFILMQWLMMGDIHWYYFKQSFHHYPGIAI